MDLNNLFDNDFYLHYFDDRSLSVMCRVNSHIRDCIRRHKGILLHINKYRLKLIRMSYRQAILDTFTCEYLDSQSTGILSHVIGDVYLCTAGSMSYVVPARDPLIIRRDDVYRSVDDMLSVFDLLNRNLCKLSAGSVLRYYGKLDRDTLLCIVSCNQYRDNVFDREIREPVLSSSFVMRDFISLANMKFGKEELIRSKLAANGFVIFNRFQVSISSFINM